MNKYLTAVALAGFLMPGIAAAKDGTGCGLGTKLFDGQSGVGPQLLAITTNGTSGNQSFGISSGTLGCDPDGTVEHMASVSEFANDNMDQLASDVAAGEGESLATVGSLLGLASADRDRFNRVMQDNFSRLFPSASTTSNEVVTSMEAILAEDPQLQGYVS